MEPNRHGHDYSEGYRSPDGYAVCCQCGARENTDRSVKPCSVKVFPMFYTTQDWEVTRRMVKDRARAETLAEVGRDWMPWPAPEERDAEATLRPYRQRIMELEARVEQLTKEAREDAEGEEGWWIYRSR